MGKVKRGGYIFVQWLGDHPPRHVHVYKDNRLILKFNQEKRVPMKGRLTGWLLRMIEELEKENKI